MKENQLFEEIDVVMQVFKKISDTYANAGYLNFLKI